MPRLALAALSRDSPGYVIDAITLSASTTRGVCVEPEQLGTFPGLAQAWDDSGFDPRLDIRMG